MLYSLNRVLSRINIPAFEPGGNIMRCIDEAHEQLSGQYHLLDEELAVQDL
jgi:hypothetical protein